MQRPPPGQVEHDPDSTDRLPVPPLAGDEGGSPAVPRLPPEPAALRPRARAPEDPFVSTDSFNATDLATPMAAKAVNPSDLAASLRDHELRLEALGRQLADAQAALEAANRRCVELEAAAEREAATTVQSPATAALRIDWHTRFIELEKVLEAERERAARRQRDQQQQIDALHARLAAAEAPQPAARAAARAPHMLSAGNALRVLVREEDGAETVYPLGRHTTIGRTPDNDIQLNTTFVSRHHAVLLAGNEHCIVEDLNSTNGIAVNGQRVGRQLLGAGDVLTIGNTQFRYEIRS